MRAVAAKPLLLLQSDRRVVHVAVLSLAGFGVAGLGASVAQGGRRGILAMAVAVLPAALVLAVEFPLACFVSVAVLLASFSEASVDNNLWPGAGIVFSGHLTVPEVLVYLLVAAYMTRTHGSAARWPGWTATAAVALAAVTVVSAASYGFSKADFRAIRPSLALPLAILCGYWLASEYGPRRLYRILVLASIPIIVLGLYNAGTGAGQSGGGHFLSYYDPTSVFILGICAALVAFRVVDLGTWNIPYVLLSIATVATSYRRGAIVAIAAAVLIAFLWTSGAVASKRRVAWLTAVVAGAVLAEGLQPGLVLNHVERLTSFFTGSSGHDWSVNYRNFERPNAWLNIKQHWVYGIGPTAPWVVYDSFNGQFVPLTLDYLHNNFLWFWLRFGVVGLGTLVGFFAAGTLALLRQRNRLPSVTLAGGALVGTVFMLNTASPLSTTIRWPVFLGLLVGIALAELQSRSEPAGALESPI